MVLIHALEIYYTNYSARLLLLANVIQAESLQGSKRTKNHTKNITFSRKIAALALIHFIMPN